MEEGIIIALGGSAAELDLICSISFKIDLLNPLFILIQIDDLGGNGVSNPLGEGSFDIIFLSQIISSINNNTSLQLFLYLTP